MKWQSLDFTYGIAVRGWRCGLILGVLTLLHWLSDEAETVVCDKENADLTMLFDAVEVARWTVETERPPRSSLS